MEVGLASGRQPGGRGGRGGEKAGVGWRGRKCMNAEESPRSTRNILTYLGIGLIAGLMSGMFGVGGGTVIVPLLVLMLHFNQRFAAGTSLAAIVPTAIVGVISYAVTDSVAWIPALILAAGSVVGAQIGTWLLPKISQTALRWGFVAFIVVVIVSLFLVVPSRDAELVLNAITIPGLVLLGLITGVLAGLLGVGGGVVVVPVLMLVFGASDLIAKGTSLLMMIPTAISGTIGNLRRNNVDVVGGLTIGLAACATTALGTWISVHMDPRVANILFAAYLVVIGAQMATKAIRGRKAKD